MLFGDGGIKVFGLTRESFSRFNSWDVLAVIFLATWHLFYYWPVSIGQKVFIDGDILFFFLPVRTELARALADGRLPLWSPGIEAGFPLFAEGQVAALYPLNLLLYRFLPIPLALSWTILLHLSWASAGMFLLARAFGLRVASATLAGFVFAFSGFFIARFQHLSLIATASWLPWLLLFQFKYWSSRAKGNKNVTWFLLITLSFGLQFLAGFPPLAFLNTATFILFGMHLPLTGHVSTRDPVKIQIVDYLRQLPQAILMTMLPIALGMGLAAIQLLPTAELVSQSIRGQDLGEKFLSSYSLEPYYLTQFISPFGVLGQPYVLNLEFWGYMGVLPFLLAILAPVLSRDLRTWIFFLFALLMLSLVFGKYNPFYEFLYNIPIFNRFRAPVRFLFLFTFAVAYLAANSFDKLTGRLRDASLTRWMPPTIAIFSGLTLHIIYSAYDESMGFWMNLWAWLPICFVSLTMAMIVAAKLRLVNQVVFGVGVLGLTVLDLSTFAAPFLTTLSQMASPSEAVTVPRTVQAMDGRQTVYRVYSDKFPAVTRASLRAALVNNIPLTYGKEAAKAYSDSLELLRNNEYIKEMSSSMRNLLNIRYYIFPVEPLPWDDPPSLDAEPRIGLSLEFLSQQPSIPPTRVSRVEMVSYTNQTTDLLDDTVVGEVLLTLDSGRWVGLPIRLGRETADWAYDGIERIGKVKHSKPPDSLPFPAFLSSVGRDFQGNKYIAHYDLATEATPSVVTSVGVRSFLPDGELAIEHVSLIDETGHSVSLAFLLNRNDLALVFRSHTAEMWENRDVLPRAFIVHQAEKVRNEEVLARLRASDFRPDRVALLSDAPSMISLDVTSIEDAQDEVLITEYNPERVVARAKTASLGYLILTDSWYPGWTALVDGKAVDIIRANYIFRAVPIQSGEHEIVFEYHPASFTYGLWISIATCAVIVFLSVAGSKFV